MDGHRDRIGGLILAGGAGRRMGGADKGLLAWHGAPLVAHVASRLRPQVAAIAISANRNLEAYAPFADRVLVDAVGGFRGPLAGIAAGLADCAQPWLLCVPVDLPLLPSDLAARLRVAAEAAGAMLAVAHDGGRRQVLCALLRPALAASARDALARGDGAVHSWQDQHAALEVDFSDQAQAFANFNRFTPG
jgi:molybdopterin-guanine dinucleotide biosynthesis protein A